MSANSQVRPLLTFSVLVFAISWLGYLPFFLIDDPKPWWLAALILPGAGPAMAAGIAARGASRLKTSYTRSIRWPWYFVAALTPATLILVASTISGNRHPAFAITPLAITFAIDLTANPCEEVGWRGFLLPRLQARYNPILATLIVGTLTALWHLPLFLWPPHSASPMRMSDIPFLPWATAHLAASVLFTYLYNATSRSLLIVSLFHLSFNMSAALLGIGSYPVLAVVEIIAALVLLLVCGSELGRKNER